MSEAIILIDGYTDSRLGEVSRGPARDHDHGGSIPTGARSDRGTHAGRVAAQAESRPPGEISRSAPGWRQTARTSSPMRLNSRLFRKSGGFWTKARVNLG